MIEINQKKKYNNFLIFEKKNIYIKVHNFNKEIIFLE